jgi:hypothetical protein
LYASFTYSPFGEEQFCDSRFTELGELRVDHLQRQPRRQNHTLGDLAALLTRPSPASAEHIGRVPNLEIPTLTGCLLPRPENFLALDRCPVLVALTVEHPDAEDQRKDETRDRAGENDRQPPSKKSAHPNA